MLYFFEFLLTIIFIIAMIYFLVLKNKKIFVVYLFTIYQVILIVLSSIYIEGGHYILELGKYSYLTGGTIRLIFYLTIFFIVFYIGIKCAKIDFVKKEKENKINICIYKILPLVAYACLGYVFIDLVISGIPLFNTSMPNKYNYYIEVSKLPLTSKIYTLLINYIPLIYSIYYLYIEKFKSRKELKRIRISVVLFILLDCLYLFLLGFKVSRY